MFKGIRLMNRVTFSRESRDFRRTSLIEATAQCLAELGVAGTSVRAICARAGVSPGLLRHYFDGVDALISETYRDTLDRLDGALESAVAAAGPDPRAQLIAYATASFRPPISDSHMLATWIAYWSMVKADPAMAALHGESYAAYRAGLATLLGACGVPAAEHGELAIELTALIDGLWLELTLDPTTFGADRACAIATRWVDRVLP